MQHLNTKQFTYGAAASATLAVVLFCLTAVLGKNECFLLFNANLGIAADYFFAAITNGGDGFIWAVTLLVTIFILKQPKAWPLVVSGIVISTILTQVPKNFITPIIQRPWAAIADHSLIHHVSFVQPLQSFSFPSGHTATAFSIYLTFCLLTSKKWWLYTGFVYAVLVGYSRVYLAQHFPLDVAGGITVAIISTYLSMLIQKAAFKKFASQKA